MSSVNKVIIIGNMGKDPEIRAMQNGNRIANLTIATSDTWKDKQTGERKEKTEWHRVVVMNDRLVDVIENYVRKGSKLYVEGQIKTRKWTNKDDAEQYSTDIVVGAYDGSITLLDKKDGASVEHVAAETQKIMGKPLDDDFDSIIF